LTEHLLRVQNWYAPPGSPSRLSLHAVKLWLDPPSIKAETVIEAEPSNVRTLLVDIVAFDGFFDTKFDILKPRWLRTAGQLT
jgi:hypothetical protein